MRAVRIGSIVTKSVGIWSRPVFRTIPTSYRYIGVRPSIRWYAIAPGSVDGKKVNEGVNREIDINSEKDSKSGDEKTSVKDQEVSKANKNTSEDKKDDDGGKKDHDKTGIDGKDSKDMKGSNVEVVKDKKGKDSSKDKKAKKTKSKKSKKSKLRLPRLKDFKLIPQPAGGIVGNVNEAVTVPEMDIYHGSFSWDYERIVATAMVPLMLTPFVFGVEHPYIDATFTSLLLLHCRYGFLSCIIDYIPKRRYGLWHKIAVWTLNLGTFLSAYGVYLIETEGNGLFTLIAHIWGA